MTDDVIYRVLHTNVTTLKLQIRLSAQGLYFERLRYAQLKKTFP
jgi:hypothetical protein